jgi:putative hydrolase of the HAD superfamily
MSRGALFLDVGWTLIHPEQSMWEILADIARSAGASMSAAECEAVIYPLWNGTQDEAVELFRPESRFEDSDEAFIGMFRQLARLALAVAGVTSPPDDAIERFVGVMGDWDRWRVYADVPEQLACFRDDGFVLAAVSNATADLPAFLEHLGLARFFDVILASAAEGTRKPDRRMFQRALERTGVGADAALHVGDMGLEDIIGARNAGLAAALMHRGPCALFPSFPPKLPATVAETPIVSSLAEVRALLVDR